MKLNFRIKYIVLSIVSLLVLLIVIPIILYAPTDTRQREQKLYKLLDIIAMGDHREVFKFIITIEEGIDKKLKEGQLSKIDKSYAFYHGYDIIEQWLEDREITHLEPNPFYALYYSDVLFKIGQWHDSEGHTSTANRYYSKSYTYLYAFKIIALIDESRCDDISAKGSISNMVSTGRFRDFEKVVERLSIEIKQEAITAALDFEEKLANRPARAEMCQSGAKAYSVTLSDPQHTETIISDSSVVGGKRTLITPSQPYVPTFVTDDAWKIERNKIRLSFEKASVSF